MQVRHAIAAVSVAAFALTLSACTGDDNAPTTTDDPTPVTSESTSPAPSPTASGAAPAVVTIRDITDGYSLEGTANSLRTGFPSFAEKTDSEIEEILNAGCDAIDAKGAPQAAADAIQTYGIDVYDAVISVSAAITLYCPEYTSFLSGSS